MLALADYGICRSAVRRRGRWAQCVSATANSLTPIVRSRDTNDSCVGRCGMNCGCQGGRVWEANGKRNERDRTAETRMSCLSFRPSDSESARAHGPARPQSKGPFRHPGPSKPWIVRATRDADSKANATHLLLVRALQRAMLLAARQSATIVREAPVRRLVPLHLRSSILWPVR
ncbi:hypothetical protein C8T65DRAFT_650873, partial [Cerioporus squamosus]